MSKRTCACTNKSKGARCTIAAKPGTIYCGTHAKCANPWGIKPIKPSAIKPSGAKVKLQDRLKSVRHSDKKEELIYICGNKENCLPVENSDLLLKFINGEGYANTIFNEIMFKTLQVLYPQACFLHPVRIWWRNNNHYRLGMTQQNVDKISYTHYIIETHAGRENSSPVELDFEKYKKDEIDKCQAGKRTLMAIPIQLLGHENMLVIDPRRKEVEHIDPHGSKYMTYSNYVKVNARIEKDVRHLCLLLFPGYKYINRSDISDFQAKLNEHFVNSIHGGTCVVWSLWYAYLRLSNPDESRVNILRYARTLLEKNNFSELENFIIKFMKQLTSLIHLQQKEDHFVVNGRKIYK